MSSCSERKNMINSLKHTENMKTMKQTWLWIAAVMVMAGVMAAGCEKEHGRGGADDEEGGGGGNGKQLTKMTVVENGIVAMVAEIEWDGTEVGRLVVKEATQGGTLSDRGYAEPTYNRSGLIESILVHSNEYGMNQMTDLYYNSQQQVETIETGTNDIEIEYDSEGNISSITGDGESIDITWNGNNPSRISTAEGTIRLRWGTLDFPLNAVLKSVGIKEGLNCPTSITNAEGYTYTISYESQDNHPAVATISGIAGEGSVTQIYFEYSDGTGGQAPAPTSSYLIYFHPYNGDEGDVWDQNGHRNTELRCAAGSTLTIYATPNSGYYFSHWQDGNDDNPRVISVTGDAEYVAYFTPESGGGSDEGTMTINFNGTSWQPYSVDFYNYTYENYIGIRAYKSSNPDDANVMFFLEAFTGSYTYDDYYSYADYQDPNHTFTPTETRIINGDTLMAGTNYYKYVTVRSSYRENITAIDLSALTISATWSEDVIDIEEYYDNYGANYNTYTLSGTLNNYHWGWTYKGTGAANSTGAASHRAPARQMKYGDKTANNRR